MYEKFRKHLFKVFRTQPPQKKRILCMYIDIRNNFLTKKFPFDALQRFAQGGYPFCMHLA